MVNNDILKEKVRVKLLEYGISNNFDIVIDLSHRRTGNYWIEIGKNYSSNKCVPTGIFIDNLHFYVVGYTDGFYVLSTKQLIQMQTKFEIKNTLNGYNRGFLLSIPIIEKICIHKIIL